MTTQSITTLILGTAPENATPATHILAGPWCAAPASAEETGFDMPPEPLADPERLETVARQARQLVTQLAPRLRDYLNGLYGTQQLTVAGMDPVKKAQGDDSFGVGHSKISLESPDYTIA